MYCKILTIGRSGKGKTVEAMKRSVVFRDWGRGEDQAEHRGVVVSETAPCDVIEEVHVTVRVSEPAECARRDLKVNQDFG